MLLSESDTTFGTGRAEEKNEIFAAEYPNSMQHNLRSISRVEGNGEGGSTSNYLQVHKKTDIPIESAPESREQNLRTFSLDCSICYFASKPKFIGDTSIQIICPCLQKKSSQNNNRSDDGSHKYNGQPTHLHTNRKFKSNSRQFCRKRKISRKFRHTYNQFLIK